MTRHIVATVIAATAAIPSPAAATPSHDDRRAALALSIGLLDHADLARLSTRGLRREIGDFADIAMISFRADPATLADFTTDLSGLRMDAQLTVVYRDSSSIRIEVTVTTERGGDGRDDPYALCVSRLRNRAALARTAPPEDWTIAGRQDALNRAEDARLAVLTERRAA